MKKLLVICLVLMMLLLSACGLFGSIFGSSEAEPPPATAPQATAPEATAPTSAPEADRDLPEVDLDLTDPDNELEEPDQDNVLPRAGHEFIVNGQTYRIIEQNGLLGLDNITPGQPVRRIVIPMYSSISDPFINTEYSFNVVTLRNHLVSIQLNLDSSPNYEYLTVTYLTRTVYGYEARVIGMNALEVVDGFLFGDISIIDAYDKINTLIDELYEDVDDFFIHWYMEWISFSMAFDAIFDRHPTDETIEGIIRSRNTLAEALSMPRQYEFTR